MKNKNIRLWRWVAVISGAFTILICFLLMATYFQLNRLDPVETEAINTLVQRLSENPDDEALRNEIRSLDLLVRKAYFTNQWQVKTGGYIAFISLAIMLIAIQIISQSKPVNPKLEELEDTDDLLFKKRSRKWISIGGVSIVLIALVLAFLTHEKLETKFTRAAIAEVNKAEVKTEVKEEVAQNTEQDTVVPDNKPNAKTDEKEVVKETKPKTETKPKSQSQSQSQKPKASASNYMEKMKGQFPTFRGAGGLGIAYQKNIPTQWDGTNNQNIKWKVKIDYKGYNSPIIWGDKLFLTGADASKKEVFCYNKNTGVLLWAKEITGIPNSPAAPAVTDDTGHAAPTAATDGEQVYAIFSNGDIVALDMNGKMVWGKNLGLPRNHYGHSSSLYTYENKLIVQYDQGNAAKVLALSTKDGSQIWSTPRQVKISWASPVLIERNGKVEVVLSADPFVCGYDVNTGKELWSLKCMMGEVGPSVAYENGLVFAVNEYASLVAISGGNTPEVLWESYDYLSDVPSPIAYHDLLFLPTSYGVVVCYNAKTGEIIWEHEFSDGFYSSPILVNGLIYLPDMNGNMQIFKAENKFELVASCPLGERMVTTPAFADGQIFLRSEEHLWCIGK